MRISKPLVPVVLLPFSLATFGQSRPGLKAPNVVVISEKLVTAGQPTAESLADLANLGFEAVVYLAPPTVADAVVHEPEIIRQQGMAFVNIPIQWSKPTEADFQAFVEVMNRFQGRKILVHCQANMRASAMTFLYRVIVAKAPPSPAYESVLKVWTPKNQWKDFMNAQLQQATIPFAVK